MHGLGKLFGWDKFFLVKEQTKEKNKIREATDEVIKKN